MSKNEEYTVKVTGPGHTFERKVGELIAGQVIAFVMAGATGTLQPAVGHGPSGGTLLPISAAAASAQLTPKQFMAQKKPANNYERVACLAYYLTTVRKTPHFKTKEITELNTESAHKFSNAALFVRHATSTYHYLSPAGKGQKQITTLGESVVEALPDRAKVDQAIAENRPAGKGRSRKKRL